MLQREGLEGDESDEERPKMRETKMEEEERLKKEFKLASKEVEDKDADDWLKKKEKEEDEQIKDLENLKLKDVL